MNIDSGYSVELRRTLKAPWTDVPSVRVDPEDSHHNTPALYATVRRNGEPFVRADIFPSSDGPFTEAHAWRELVLLGRGDFAHVIDPAAGTVRNLKCDGYFGSMKLLENLALIATATSIICLDETGAILWTSDTLAVDGVIIKHIADDIIHGEAEHDPPGDWHPFRISLSNGTTLETGENQALSYSTGSAEPADTRDLFNILKWMLILLFLVFAASIAFFIVMFRHGYSVGPMPP
jgi:hypothetical protein